MSDPTETKPPKRGSRILAFFIGLSLLTVVGFGCFHYFITKPAVSPVHRLADALKSITQENVRIDGSTVNLEQIETRELAVVERTSQTIVKFHTKWLGSDKLLIVKGDFIVKAGFDLTGFEGFEVKGNQVIGQWPQAKILSVEMTEYEIYYSKNGIINRLEGDDHERAVNLLRKQALEDAINKSDICEEAERIIHRRLQDLGGEDFDWENKPQELN